MNWWKLAFRLKSTPRRLQRELTGPEFLEALAYIEEEGNYGHYLDHYFAALTLEVRALRVKDPRKLSIKQFLLKFMPGKPEKDPATMTQEEKQAHVTKSKSTWFSILGLGKKD